MRIFAGFSGNGASNDSGVSETASFSLSLAVSSEPLPTLLYSDMEYIVGLPLISKRATLNDGLTVTGFSNYGTPFVSGS